MAFFGPARLILQTLSRDMRRRAQVEIAKLLLGAMAAGLLLSAAVAALAQAVGYPIAATIFVVLLGLLTLVMHLLGRAQAARQSQHMASAQARLRGNIALLSIASRYALPLLLVTGFLAPFLFARRR